MYTLIIFNVYGETPTEAQFHVGGCNAAYLAFRKAREMCELTGGSVTLIDSETGEVVADNWDEDDLGIPMPEPEDLIEPWWEG